MLSQRRRFKYINVSDDQNREPVNRNQELKNQEIILNLQKINKKIIQDTANQFGQFQRDIERVQNILHQKQRNLSELKRQNVDLKDDIKEISNQLWIKDQTIKVLEQQVRSLVKDTEDKDNLIETIRSSLKINIKTQNDQKCTQTQDYGDIKVEDDGKEQIYKSKCEQVTQRARLMQQQIYKLKEELYNSNSELSLLKQQFGSYKILRQIENVQKR